MSGYVVLVSTMHLWYSWLTNLNILNWTMNALFRNQFKGNSESLDNASYADLEELYMWNHSLSECTFYSLVICAILKLLAYFSIRWIDHTSV